jgi:uncharacterized protein
MTGLNEILKFFALGLSAGVLSGLFGIGGGLVIVPALVLLFGLDIKTAFGTSLLALLLPTGLLGVIEYGRTGHLKISAGLWIALGLFCGVYFGARVTAALSGLAMKRIYAMFLLAIGTYFLLVPQREPSKPPGPISAPAAHDVNQAPLANHR